MSVYERADIDTEGTGKIADAEPGIGGVDGDKVEVEGAIPIAHLPIASTSPT